MKISRRKILGLGAGIAAVSGTLTQRSQAAAPGTKPAAGAGGGEPKAEDLITVKKPEIAEQKTPDFSPKYVTDKRTQPKGWMEIEFPVELEKLPAEMKDAKEPVLFLDDVEFKFYVFLDVGSADKRKVLTASVTYVNVPLKEKSHVVLYVSPATLYHLTSAKLVNKSVVKYSGVEVFHGGKQIGQFSDFNLEGNPQWWKSTKAPPAEEGRLLPKSKTPFAPLWFDYHLEEKPQR
jgi:hypothetical protein